MRLRLLCAALLVAACSTSPQDREPGQTDFVSAPPGYTGAAAGGPDGGVAAVPGATGGNATGTRAVEETDIYRLDGNRLYVLNGYRGLLVFDVTDADHPALLGRSPIYGWPVEMVVHGGVATVVVSDWYGMLDDGTPFHGSVVRGLDARDPANIRKVGEVPLGGWVRDTRVVGEVLYAVSDDYGWTWAANGSATPPAVVISSVNLGTVQKMGERAYPGWSGVINVTADAILLARDESPYNSTAPQTALTYIDISDPAGAIAERGTRTVSGRLQGWAPDNGRWNLDFADGKTAHVIGCGGQWCGPGAGADYVLSTVDFADPDRPVQLSAASIALNAWSPAVRFDSGRMYLSPSGNWDATSTPMLVYDLSDPLRPRLAGQVDVPGMVWSFFPEGSSVMALGAQPGRSTTQVSVTAIDATDPAHPAVAGTAAFGDGWAWTPAAGTFKAFTRNDGEGLIVLPFSGWSEGTYSYRNGLQLIDLTAGSIHTAGAAITSGWVERGIFVGGRLMALSDQTLAVVDFSDHDHPRVVNEVALARNVVTSLPLGDRIALVNSDFWDNDRSSSLIRVLPIGEAEELHGTAGVEIQIDGVGARIFRDGDLAYAVTNVWAEAPCPADQPWRPGPDGKCRQWTQQVQVIDLSSATPRVRGKLRVPGSWDWGWFGYGWFDCYPWDWFNGADVVQVDGSALALRRWSGVGTQTLFVADLSNPDAPALSQLQLTSDPSAWWGNMVVVGTALYVTNTEWVSRAPWSQRPTVRYWANRIDLRDRAHPAIASRVNLPGVLVGGSASDASILYAMDYRWNDDRVVQSFDVLQLRGNRARLLSKVEFPGWTGNVLLRGTSAFTSVQSVDAAYHSTIALHQIDLADPAHPVDRAATSSPGWGWLVAVEGDRAVVTSGWGSFGLDIYRLTDGAPPRLDQFVRTRGYWPSAIARQDDQLFVSSGWWGVTAVQLGQ